MKPWHERVTDALAKDAPRTLYHATGKVITPRMAGKSLADLKREAELDAYFARQDRKHDAIEVASEEIK